MVREYQDEYFERHALVLDTFCARDEEGAFEEAVAVAASLAETIDTHECLLDLMFVGAEAYTFTAGRGQMHPDGLLAVLAGVAPCRERPFARAARRGARAAGDDVGCARDPARVGRARRAFVDEMRSLGLAMRVLLVSARPVEDGPRWLTVLEPGASRRASRRCEHAPAPARLRHPVLGMAGEPPRRRPRRRGHRGSAPGDGRIELTEAQQFRVADLSTLLAIAAGVAFAATSGFPKAVVLFFQWLPVVLLRLR